MVAGVNQSTIGDMGIGREPAAMLDPVIESSVGAKGSIHANAQGVFTAGDEGAIHGVNAAGVVAVDGGDVVPRQPVEGVFEGGIEMELVVVVIPYVAHGIKVVAILFVTTGRAISLGR